MLAHARLKLKNAESSIAFIQEQHTRTLEGLHKEIQKLQQKNARLTFELAIQGSSAPSDCCKHKEEELQSYKSEASSLRSALSACKEEMKLLKCQLLRAEFTLSQEVGLRDAHISTLGTELEHKSKVIAHLTKKLHHMKLELTCMSEAMQSIAAPSPAADSNGQKTTPDCTILGRIRRRVRRATASALPHDPSTQDYTEYHERMMTRRSLQTPFTHTHTPTPSPQPPSASPPQRLLHRASRVARRAAGGHVDSESPPQAVLPADPQRSCTNLHLDPVQLQKQAPDITDLLKHEENPTAAITRSSPPVLPPIPATCDVVAKQDSETTDPQYHTGYPSGYPIQQTRLGHVILTRSQQLESAPASVQVLAGRTARNMKQEERDKQGAHSREGEVEGRSPEGMLLMKEEIHQQKNQAWQELHQSGSD